MMDAMVSMFRMALQGNDIRDVGKQLRKAGWLKPWAASSDGGTPDAKGKRRQIRVRSAAVGEKKTRKEKKKKQKKQKEERELDIINPGTWHRGLKALAHHQMQISAGVNPSLSPSLPT